ncbi:membrane protein insertase YidC [Furfurilactobacillus entadae]|uniref:membrane protein insertase YidC n=1 Tax=Furfurilactobacillus entadae TaxID=2922307 RepID=UPI0035E696FF
MKKNNRIAVLSALGVLALLLSGCVRTSHGKPVGIIWTYGGQPMVHFMEWAAKFLGGNYGWAIILLTVIVRLVLLPLMLRQSRQATVQQEKMSMVRPQMQDIQARQKAATTTEEKTAISQEMMQLYRDNGISMTGGIGCLPLVIQLPIFAALYAAIRYAPELTHATFYGIQLDKPKLILAILSFLAYLLQGYLSLLGLPEDQKKQMRTMMIMSPVMILFVTFSTPAALGLYFFVGGLFACLQTLIIAWYRPRIRAQIAEELEKNPIKKPTPKPVMATETPATSAAPITDASQDKNNRQRNAGKQQHHHDND